MAREFPRRASTPWRITAGASMRRVLVVDADRGSLDKLSGTLTSDSFILQHALDGDGALHRLKAWKPHVIFLALDKNKKTHELVQRMRSASPDDYTAIVVMAEDPSSTEVASCID